MESPARIIAIGMGLAFGLFAACIIIRPHGLAANDGLSYYGSFKTTIIPYSTAFFISAYCYWEAAAGVINKDNLNRYLAYVLRIMAVLFIGLLVTPHTLVDSIHTAFGAALFALQLLVSLWLLFMIRKWQLAVGCILELAGGLAAFYYLPKSEGLLLQAQVVFQAAFWCLLIYVLAARSRILRYT